MRFADLPPQSPIHAVADRFAAAAIEAARRVAETMGERCVADLAYGSEPGQRLDLFLPAVRPRSPMPVLAFFHGGGWTHGYKEWCHLIAPALVDLPCLFACVGYRLLPTVAFPTPVEDAALALAWLHGNAAHYGGDPDGLFVSGHSAGAHIAALLATDPRRLSAVGVPPSALRACFCMSATLNRRMVNASAAPDHVPPGDEADIRPDSPLAHAANAHVPIHLYWGGREPPRVERANIAMAKALRGTGKLGSTLIAPAFDHFETKLAAGNSDDPWITGVRTRMRGTAQAGARVI